MGDGRDTHQDPPLTIDYLRALEFVVSVDSAGPRPGKPEVLKSSGRTNPWRSRAKAEASPFELSDLDLLFRPVSTVVFLFHAIIREGHREVGGLIDYFASMSEEAFLDRFKRFLRIDSSITDWINADTIELALENDRARETVPFREEAQQLAELLGSADSFRGKIVEVLSWFDERLFAPDFESRRGRVERWISDNRRQLEEDRRYALDQLTNGGYESLLANCDSIRLFPVSDSANSDTWLMLPDEAYFVFSVRYAERVLPPGPDARVSEQRTEQLMEALSDPKRIALLRLLRRRPHFAREVADELGVSASTASYHMEKLVAAHLVRLELSSGRRFFYGINPGGFRELLRLLEEEFVEWKKDEGIEEPGS